MQVGTGMKLLHLHPDDARWLSRWLRSNLVCCLAIVGILLMIRQDSVVTPRTLATVRADIHPEDEPSGPLPPESELVLLDAYPSNPVAPQGWRRTANGWEHVSTWRLSRPLGEIIRTQRAREPVWIQFTLARLRDIPPWIYALLQIAAITMIVRTVRDREVGPSRR